MCVRAQPDASGCVHAHAREKERKRESKRYRKRKRKRECSQTHLDVYAMVNVPFRAGHVRRLQCRAFKQHHIVILLDLARTVVPKARTHLFTRGYI